MNRQRSIVLLPIVVTLLSLVALASPAAPQGEEPVIPLAPIDVTAPYVLTPPEVKKITKPPYPEAARRNEEQGTVNVVVKVATDGKVSEVSVKKSSGSKTLDEAALTEAKSWQFAPARKGPKNVEAWVEVPVKFQLLE
jgi:protein TonB